MLKMLEAVKARMQATRQAEAAKERSAEENYSRLVLDSMDGKELEPDEVLKIIAAAGHTFDDFEKHIGFEQEKAALEELVAGEAVITERIKANAAEREQIGKDVAAFNQQIEARMKALERNESGQRIGWDEISRAKTRLANYLGVGRGFKSTGQELPKISREGNFDDE